MGNYNRDDRSGDRRGAPQRDFGRRSFGGNRRPVEMHTATCSNCGKTCEVPFRPNGSKPVYCNDCFKTFGDRPDSGRFPDRAPRSPQFEARNDSKPQDAEQLSSINRKLDKILQILTSTPMSTKTEIIAAPETAITIVAPVKKSSKKAPVVKE